MVDLAVVDLWRERWVFGDREVFDIKPWAVGSAAVGLVVIGHEPETDRAPAGVARQIDLIARPIVLIRECIQRRIQLPPIGRDLKVAPQVAAVIVVVRPVAQSQLWMPSWRERRKRPCSSSLPVWAPPPPLLIWNPPSMPR